MKRKQPEPKPTAQEPTPSTEEEPVKKSIWVQTGTPLDGWTDARSMGLLDATASPAKITVEDALQKAENWRQAFQILRWYFCSWCFANGGEVMPYRHDPTAAECEHFVAALYDEYEACAPHGWDSFDHLWKYPETAPLLPTYEEARDELKKIIKGKECPSDGGMPDAETAKRMLCEAIEDYILEFNIENLQDDSVIEAALRELADKGILLTAQGVERTEKVSAFSGATERFKLDLLARIFGCIDVRFSSNANSLDIHLPLNAHDRWNYLRILRIVNAKYNAKSVAEHEAVCRDIPSLFNLPKGTDFLLYQRMNDAIARLEAVVVGENGATAAGPKKPREPWEHENFSHTNPIIVGSNRIIFYPEDGTKVTVVTNYRKNAEDRKTYRITSPKQLGLLDQLFDALEKGDDQGIPFPPRYQSLFREKDGARFKKAHIEPVIEGDGRKHGRSKFTFTKKKDVADAHEAVEKD